MELLGVRLSLLSAADVLHQIEVFLDTNSLHHVVTVNPEYMVEAQQNEKFRTVLNKADLALIDGIGIVIALEYLEKRGVQAEGLLTGSIRFLGYALLHAVLKKRSVWSRLTGVDLIWLLVQQDYMKGRKIYLLGGKDHVSSAAVKRLFQFNEAIQFRSSNGLDNVRQIDSVQNQKIIDDINSFAPDVLLVAYGHPWQDLWIADHASVLKTRVAIGVGGAFDYISQRVSRAPGWIRALGFEWLFRLIHQPSRFPRIIRAVWVFMKLVITRNSS